MGDKYILELEDKPFHKEDGDFLYRVKGFNSLVFDMTGIGKLTPYTEPDLEQVKKEAYEKGWKEAEDHYEKGYNDGYDTGLEDAWKVADKIFDMPCLRREQIFSKCDSVGVWDILRKYSASEAIEKIRQYEQGEEEQIQVGDEVITASGKAVVTGVGPVHFEYVYADGSHGYDEVKNLKKTGRHFPEISAVLQKMQMKDGDNE